MYDFTLDTLPERGRLYVFATADVVTDESAAYGDLDRGGYVSDLYGTSDVVESRANAEPLLTLDVAEIRHGRDYGHGVKDTPEEVRREILDTLDMLGAYEDNGDGTYYKIDPVIHNDTSGEWWQYAMHVSVIHYTHDGYRKDPVSVLD